MAKNGELLKYLFELIEAHRGIFSQERIYKRVEALLLAELFVFGRHTITQLPMTLGETKQDWSAGIGYSSKAALIMIGVAKSC